MALTVRQDPQGPLWPLGLISVATPGTPVGIMSLVDSAGVNDPNAATTTSSDEYTRRCYGFLITPCQSNAGTGTKPNTGNIYIMKRGKGAGAGNRTDFGCMIMSIPQGAATTPVLPGELPLQAAPMDRNVFNPYDIYIDADNANDGALVTLLIM